METIELTAAQYRDLRTAFEQSSYDTECYLDTEAGEVVWFSPDAPGVDREPDDDAPEWKREAYERRRAVWEDETGRYLRVPPGDRSDVRDDIEQFLAEEAGPRLRRRFDADSVTRAEFEPFRRALQEDPEARSEWNAFRGRRSRARIEAWLEIQEYQLDVAESQE